MSDPKLYKDAADSILLTVWDDGTHEVSFRDPESRSWGPPVKLAAVSGCRCVQ